MEVGSGYPLSQAPASAVLSPPGTSPASNRWQTAELSCPKIMVGRVIGKNGETIKALQIFTGALIQIDQSVEPTRVTVSGTMQSLSLALSMISDICKGTFKGFALLRQISQQQRGNTPMNPALLQLRPVYAPGYGLIPPSQLYGTKPAQDVIQPLVQPQDTTVQLPAGVQYLSGPTVSAPPRIVLGLPASGGLGVTQAIPTMAPIPQAVPLQQVYRSYPLAKSNPYGAQLAYYPLQQIGTDGQLFYQQDPPNGISMPPATTGNAKLLHATIGQPKSVPLNPEDLWDLKMKQAGTMPQHSTMNTLLMGESEESLKGQLVQMVDEEGRLTYFFSPEY